MSKELVFGLAEASNLGAVGGKAHALGRMIQAGFNIPKGFVVSTAAFMSMTPTLQTELLEHFDELQADFVAVRSSAVNEDGSDAAWAGQLDTFLNIQRATLMLHIEKCWESAGSTRAKAYAEQKALDSGLTAVIVQKMIQSDVSGVAFSVHPISKDSNQIVIEAGYGLGEAVVSGQITPDTYILDKLSGETVAEHVAHQTQKLVKDSAGNNVWEELGTHGKTQKLDTQQVKQLSGIVNRLESYFGYPTDVEWALHNDVFYILQSRPITTLA